MKKVLWYLGYALIAFFSVFIIAYAFIESFFVESDDFQDAQFLKSEAQRTYDFNSPEIVENLDSMENSYA
jgi:ABC-type Fe3+ transport system permease subunit